MTAKTSEERLRQAEGTSDAEGAQMISGHDQSPLPVTQWPTPETMVHLPTIGRTVHYRLTTRDAEDIARRRTDWLRHGHSLGNSGAQAHVGRAVHQGMLFAMIVTRVGEDLKINGQAFLDGSDSLWVVGAPHGTEPGQWCWPERV